MIAAAYAAEHAAAAAHRGSFYAEPEFWTAVAFVLVVALAFRKVAGAVAAVLDARSVRIKEELDNARKMREDAHALLAQYQRKQREALQEAEDIVAHAKHEAERIEKEAEDALEASIQRREKQAEDRVLQAESQALADVRDMAVDLAMATAAKLIAEKINPDAQDALIANSIKSLPGTLQKTPRSVEAG